MKCGSHRKNQARDTQHIEIGNYCLQAQFQSNNHKFNQPFELRNYVIPTVDITIIKYAAYFEPCNVNY